MPFFDTPATTFDPYSQDRMQHMDLLKQAQGDYARGMQAPLGFLDPEMQRYLESKTREDVRSANPKAGGSGWLQDRTQTELLKLRMAMLDKNLQEGQNQRSFLAQLSGQQMPTQQVPGETGILSTAGAQMMGQAGGGFGVGLGNAIGDWLFGPKQQSTPASWRPGSYNPNQSGNEGY